MECNAKELQIQHAGSSSHLKLHTFQSDFTWPWCCCLGSYDPNFRIFQTLLRSSLTYRAHYIQNDPCKHVNTSRGGVARCIAWICVNKPQSYDFLFSANSVKMTRHPIIPSHSCRTREPITGLAPCLIAGKAIQRPCGHHIIVRECVDLRTQRPARRNFDFHQNMSLQAVLLKAEQR